jgi:hypothetical protein
MLLEGVRDQMSFGIKGPIPVEPASSLCDDVNPDVLAMVDSGDRSIPRRMIGDTKYFGGTKVWDAYVKYSDAIDNRWYFCSLFDVSRISISSTISN